MGMMTPAQAASSRLRAIAPVITRPSETLPYSHHASTPSSPPQAMPLNRATPSSFFSKRFMAEGSTWPMAIARTIIVVVWLPELPPMPATMGISAASATSFSIEPSNRPITREATKAVTRFTASQAQRFFTESHTEAKMSSPSRRPALLRISASDSSRM